MRPTAVLCGLLVVAWVVALQEGSPGPGVATLLVHAVAAVVAVLAQVFADRTAGPWGALAARARGTGASRLAGERAPRDPRRDQRHDVRRR